MDGSRAQPKMTAGVDLGDKYSYLCLIDTQSGEVIEEGRLRTTPEAFERRFSSEQQPLRIAIEAGTHSPWVSRLLEECGHEVLVANPRKTRLIYSNKRKTDEMDAENLARLARLDPKLLYPLKHRGEDSQAHLAIIRSREALVGSRTQLVNHVGGAVKSFGGRLPKCPARSFHNKAPITHSSGDEQRWMKHPVLVGVGKLAEHPEPMVRELVPSVVRLQTLDDCLRGWCDAPDLIHAFVQEVVLVFEDGELRIFSDALGQRVAPIGFGKVIDEVVEGGPHVVQTLPDDKSEFGGRVFKDFNLYELVSSLRIEFCVNTVRAWFGPPTAFAFEALQVARGPFQPKFAVIHVVESPLVSLGP